MKSNSVHVFGDTRGSSILMSQCSFALLWSKQSLTVLNSESNFAKYVYHVNLEDQPDLRT